MPQCATSKWNVGVRQYLVFAEYTEGMVANGSSGVSDTGLTMRAFLPMDSQGNRSSVHKYMGPAAVVDARVVCVRPNITSSLADLDIHKGAGSLSLRGNVSIPEDILQEAAASQLRLFSLQSFNCSTSHITLDATCKYYRSDWDLSICQLGGLSQASGFLKNAWAFSDHRDKYDSSTSYLLVNLSNTPKVSDRLAKGVNLTELQRIFNNPQTGLVRQNRGDWTEVYPTNYGLTAADGMLSFSLCFQAAATQYIDVVASSVVPIVQPRYSYDSVDGRFRFDQVRKQMLSPPHSTSKQRGILSLEPQRWEEIFGGKPRYLTNADLGAALSIDPSANYSTAYLLQYYEHPTSRADISIGGLLLEILREGGTTAEAVQSMFTTFIASRYQDYTFFEQRGVTYTIASRAGFVAVQIPRGSGRATSCAAGATRSYTVVMVAIAVHILTVSFVFVWFCKGKRI
jgi:hypothetical protein